MIFRFGAVASLLLAAPPSFATSLQRCSALMAAAPEYWHVAGWRIAAETSAEAELPLEAVLPQLETTDGTVGPVLEPSERIPRWFARSHGNVAFLPSILSLSPFPASLEQVSWKALTPAEQWRLVRDVHRELATSPPVLRAAAMKMLDSVLPPFIPGLALVPPAGDPAAVLLDRRIGYVLERTNPSWGEVHLRGTLSPGEARAAMFRLFPEAPSVHVHCPVPLAVGDLVEEELEGAALRTDLALRANAVAEIASVLYRRTSLRRSPRHGTVAGSAPLSRRGAVEMARLFLRLARGDARPPKYPWLTKNAFVGVRHDSLYDRHNVEAEDFPPSGGGASRYPARFVFVGLEHRYLRRGKAGVFGEFPTEALPLVDAFMEASRVQLARGSFHAMRPAVHRWIGDVPPLLMPGADLALESLARNAWYRAPEVLWRETLPEHLRDEGRWTRAKLQWAYLRGHEEVAALAFNWRRFALVAGDRKLAARVAAAQREGWGRVRHGTAPAVAARLFFAESGLFAALLKSFEMSDDAAREAVKLSNEIGAMK